MAVVVSPSLLRCGKNPALSTSLSFRIPQCKTEAKFKAKYLGKELAVFLPSILLIRVTNPWLPFKAT